MKRFSILAAFLLATAISWAQAAPDWYLGKPIRDISFSGIVHVDRGELQGLVRPFVGKDFTNELWIELQAAVYGYGLDYFDQINPMAEPGDPEYRSVIVRFTVVEKPWIEAVRVEGNSGLRSSEVLDAAVTKSGDIYREDRARLDEIAIRARYLEKGYPDVRVSSATSPGKTADSVVLRFIVDEGSQVAIGSILFDGNASFSASTLKGLLELKERGLFQAGAFQESKLESDRLKLLQHYRSKGFIDAAVPDVARELVADEASGRNDLALTFRIVEGRQYRFGGISFEGNRIFDSEKLGSLVRLKSDDILDYPKLLADKGRIDDLYYESGYIFNRVELREERDAERGVVSYVVSITERGRAHIESIEFRGNEKTREHVLARELPLEVGDVFSKTKIMEGLRNLYNLQYFSAIEPEMMQGSAESLMALVINVEEQSTADIQFGVTLSGLGTPGAFPLSGLVKWNDRNFLGNGQTFSVDLNASPTEQSLVFSFVEPWLLGRRWSGGVDLSMSHKTIKTLQDVYGPVFGYDEPGRVPDPYSSMEEYLAAGQVVPDDFYMLYQEWEISLGLSTGYRFRTPLGDLGVGTGISSGLTLDTYADGSRPYDAVVAANHDKWLWANSFFTRAYLNALDLWYDPSDGWYASQRFTFKGLLPVEVQQFIRSDTKLEGYLTLVDLPVSDSWSFKAVLGAHSGLSFLLPNWNGFEYTSTNALRIDGTFVGRGWGSGLSTKEGTALWENWLELRVPLAAGIISLDGFLDAAALASDEYGLLVPSTGSESSWDAAGGLASLSPDNMAFSLGFGFRFAIPQFPFRFYFAKTFTLGDDWSFEWPADKGLDFVISITQPLY